MGCFTVSKSKKKRSDEQIIFIKPTNLREHTATSLPEPQVKTRSLQSAPPSFRIRAKPVLQPDNRVVTSRTRTLSSSSILNATEQDDHSSVEFEEQEEPKSRFGSMKENRSPSPQPLPLPPPQSASVLKTMESFKLRNVSGPLNASGPLPLPPMGTLRNFSYEEITSACYNFFPERSISEGFSSVIYRASFGDDTSGSKKLEATVTCLNPSTQGLKEFVNEANTLASLQHPNLCKLLGFHAREGSERKMLVYERLFHGSLDRLLYGRSDGPPIDWNSRMKVALCAAQGLTFLHEEGPFQAMFHEFSTGNVQIDKDFSAKLSGYGCISHIPETDISDSSVAHERGLLTPKSNVWSFGIMLLELLTGRKNLDSRHPKEERNLVKWSGPYLTDDSRLSLIMDPRLKGRFPSKAARMVADIAQRCLKNDPSERPTMRTIVDQLKVIQEMKYSSLFPLQEPGSVSGKKNVSRWPSLSRILNPPPAAPQPSIPMNRALGRPLSLPPRTCLSVIVLEENDRQDVHKLSALPIRRYGVEGF